QSGGQMQEAFWLSLTNAAQTGNIVPLRKALEEVLSSPPGDGGDHAERIVFLMRQAQQQRTSEKWPAASQAAARAILRMWALDERMKPADPRAPAAQGRPAAPARVRAVTPPIEGPAGTPPPVRPPAISVSREPVPR